MVDTGLFDGLISVGEIDRVYKEQYHILKCSEDTTAYWGLSEGRRRACERLISERIPELPEGANRDPNYIHPLQLRNWAQKQGIPLPKRGRVGRDIENAYRAEHDLPLIEGTKPVKVDTGASSSEVRAWARENDIAVGVRGRVHPDVIAAFVEAHPAAATA